MAGGRGGGVVDTITIAVVKPLAVGDVGEIAVEGDLDGLSRRTPRAATREQDGVADDLETVVGNQSGGDVVLHSGNPFRVGGSWPLLMVLL